MTTLLEYYRQDATRQGFQADEAQTNAVKHLQRVYVELVSREAEKKHLLNRFKARKPVKGLYMWGGVGRGKTYLMDLFYQHIPITKKRRQHFNHFMQDIHQQLKRFEGKKNPLLLVAQHIAKDTILICFDELVVVDIADAMILGGLFTALFEQGICLVTTSNVTVDDLYQDGLHRDRFLPAIEVIRQAVDIINVDAGVDYRGKAPAINHRYHTPLQGQADFMRAHFSQVAEGTPQQGDINVAGRPLSTIGHAENVAWLDFNVLCNEPRSVADYIALADRFDTVLLSNVIQMHAGMDDYARRFITLVDEFYDRNTRLILSANVPLENLYSGTRLAFEFERTYSRLQEMTCTKP
jgi:cell division protein ZapE